MVGKDITIENPELQAMMRHEDINGDQIHFLGERKDITKIMSAIDILALPSDGEAFPNVVGEAMACETPSVVTDVGDCAAIVGETGRVVPPGDMAKFAEAVLDLLSKPKSERQSMGRAARARVKKLYDLDRVARDYRDLYVKHVHAAKVSR
jgi:glycosyltransferase involved in cell wall biosynthesis